MPKMVAWIWRPPLRNYVLQAQNGRLSVPIFASNVVMQNKKTASQTEIKIVSERHRGLGLRSTSG